MMRRRTRTWLSLALSLIFSRFCLADGKMFSPVTAKVEIPDQSAVIGFDGQTERLIISTAFRGPKGEYAWVVPLPAVPKVERVSNGIIPTLRSMSRPRVVNRVHDWSLIALAGVCMWIAVFVRRQPVLVFLFLLCLIALPFALWHARRQWMQASLSGGELGGIAVSQHMRVGEYDVATLTATSAQTLLDWLAENGFQVSPTVGPALADYIRDGWCFTTYRFSPESGSSRTHPLSFTFPTKRAVYPMRLTAIESEGMSLDLFVLGDQEAIVPGMERRRCGFLKLASANALKYGTVFGYRYEEARYDRELLVLHPGVEQIAKPYKVMTALHAQLSPRQMKSDFYLEWRKPRPYRRILYSAEAAASLSRRYGAIIFTALTLLATLWFAFRTWTFRALAHVRVAWIVWLVAAIVITSVLVAFRQILTANVPDAVLAGGLVLFLCVLIGAVLVPWRAKLIAAAPLYFVGTGALVLLAPMLFEELHGKSPAVYFIACACIAALAFVGSLAWYGSPLDRERGLPRRAGIVMLVTTLIGALAWTVSGLLLDAHLVRDVVEHRGGTSIWGYYGELSDAMTYPSESQTLWRNRVRSDSNSSRRSDEEASYTEAELRNAVSERAALLHSNKNPYSGEAYREEDSPGNYELVREDDRLILYAYDVNGGAMQMGSTLVKPDTPTVRTE